MTDLKLLDFNWNLEYVLGSDSVSEVGRPVVHIRFDLSEPPERLFDFQLEPDQLKELTSQLESALSN